jgi:hypothetical protein
MAGLPVNIPVEIEMILEIHEATRSAAARVTRARARTRRPAPKTRR